MGTGKVKSFKLDILYPPLITVFKLINLIENHSISELVDNCLAKNKAKTLNILAENHFNNEESVLITRIFLNKLKKILLIKPSNLSILNLFR